MKSKVLVFLGVVLLSLLVVPVINLTQSSSFRKLPVSEVFDSTFLYNVDFALPVLGRLGYFFGVSIAPSQVVIGKEGWLYLGDAYESSITSKRFGLTERTAHEVAKVNESALAWEEWYKKNGVKEYRIMVGPDKHTIYPEYLPLWARQAETTAVDHVKLLGQVGVYVDTVNAIKSAKEKYSENLYYKTDTHWNSLGAWLAFDALSRSVPGSGAVLKWPEKELGRVASVTRRAGGDLAAFLRINDYLIDSALTLGFSTNYHSSIKLSDYATGKPSSMRSNSGVAAPRQPLLVVSSNALNSRKVLWLRDSFGGAMRPYMGATFETILEVDYRRINAEVLAKLVRKFKPDYVFVTVVERSLLNGIFQSQAPLLSSVARNEALNHVYGGLVRVHDMVALPIDVEQFKVSGTDPYFVFDFSRPIASRAVQQFVIDLNCANGQTSVPLQVYWRTKNVGFTEADSIKITVNQGVTAIDVSRIPSWTSTDNITSVRVDLVSPSGCPVISIKDFQLGVN